MKAFSTDLDNTMIFSYKHDIGEDKICAEIYEGREISFMTPKTLKYLQQVQEKILVVPITTRTREQYERINLGVKPFPYALVCNGGILLENGEECQEWYEESLALIEKAKEQLKLGEEILAKDPNLILDVRNIRQLFLYTKSQEPELTMACLEKELDLSLVEVLNNGQKVYVVPKSMNKGLALKRLQKREGFTYTISAGDSLFDVPMLEQADFSIAPKQLADTWEDLDCSRVMEQKGIFSEYVLEQVISCL